METTLSDLAGWLIVVCLVGTLAVGLTRGPAIDIAAQVTTRIRELREIAVLAVLFLQGLIGLALTLAALYGIVWLIHAMWRAT